MKHALRDLGHVRVPGLLAPQRVAVLARQLLEQHAATPGQPDPQVPGAPSFYNFLPFVRLLVELVPRVGELCGEAVLPTYTYGRIYGRGSVLARHTDRKACEISLTLHLQGDRPWPIALQMFGQPPVSVELASGDALLYLGCEAQHWRDAYEGERYLQVFLHYVRAHGPRAGAFFDREAASP